MLGLYTSPNKQYCQVSNWPTNCSKMTCSKNTSGHSEHAMHTDKNINQFSQELELSLHVQLLLEF